MENEENQNRSNDVPLNSFAIYQVKAGEDYRLLRFSSLSRTASVNRENYDLVYTGKLERPSDSAGMILEGLFERFNIDHPTDYTGRSMSVSDVVVLNRDGSTACYYVEPVGFKEIHGFLEDQNYLKNTEIALEDDYGMIDGILNNGEKKSIHEALKECSRERDGLPRNTSKPARARVSIERD